MKEGGAGLSGLKGSEFLLMDDWILLGRMPGSNFYERSQKLIDLHIKIKTDVEDDAIFKIDIEKLDKDLEEIIKAFEEFEKIQGSIEFRNEYRIKLVSIEFRLYRICKKAKLFPQNVIPDFKMPSKLGRFTND